MVPEENEEGGPDVDNTQIARQIAGGNGPSFAWRAIGQYLPLVAFAMAAFLIIRVLNDDSAPDAKYATVAADHAQNLAENISFFESHVAETKDSLSYNKLTGLYLQRVRETGDVSDIKRAALAAEAAVTASRRDYASLVSLAMVRVAQHDFEDAQAVAKEAMALRPSAPDSYALLGDAQVAVGKYDEATENYRVYLEKAAGSSAFARQAVLAELRGNVPLAEQFWQAAIGSDRSDAPEGAAWAQVQLGNLQFANGLLGSAGTAFETALKVYPGYPAAEAGVARVATAQGESAKAIAFYQKSTAAVPQPEYVAALGDLLQQAGRTAEAQRQFGLIDVIRQLFDANGVRNDLTLILFALDHGATGPETLERAQTAYEQRPSLAAADVYAWALYRAGRYDEARTKSSEALRLGTKDPLFLFHAGMIAKAQGDTAAARDLLGRLKTLNARFSPLHAAEAAQALKEVQ